MSKLDVPVCLVLLKLDGTWFCCCMRYAQSTLRVRLRAYPCLIMSHIDLHAACCQILIYSVFDVQAIPGALLLHGALSHLRFPHAGPGDQVP